MARRSKRPDGATLQRCTLVFKTGPLSGRRFSLGPGEFVFVGSDRQCGICVPDDPSVSAKHACIYYDPRGRIRLKDMGSQYGTKCNGRKVSGSTVIKAGDRVTFGHQSTMHSSWWNALQGSRMSRISQLISRLPTERKPKAAEARGSWAAALALALVASVAVGLGLLRTGVSPKPLPTAELATAKAMPSRKASVPEAPRLDSVKGDLTPERRLIWDEVIEISERFGDPPPSTMDLDFVKGVERCIDEWTVGNRHLTLLKRKERVWPVIVQALRSRHLPLELGYVVWVESEFDQTAMSHAGAAGLWQLVPETARDYGLVVEPGRDDRLDPQKSSVAAARYLTDLLHLFKSQSYLLALASYNSGQNRVQRAQLAASPLAGDHADFWALRRQLPAETNHYVLKILAAMIVGRSPDRWDVGH